MAADLPINNTLTIPGWYLSWTAVRASGPGGQNVNKVATKIVLRFDLLHCHVLSPRTRARLRRLAANRLDTHGQLIVTSQHTRNRIRNLDDARRKLAELITAACHRPKPRIATKPSRGAKRRRLKAKRERSAIKKLRRQPPQD